LAIYLATVFFFVRHYNQAFAFRIGQGGIGLYWRGDWKSRRSDLFNGNQWPLHSDTHFAGLDPGADYAGGDPRGLLWEVYEPRLAIYELHDAWCSGEIAVLLNHVGFCWPDIRVESEAACVVVPLGPVAAASLLTLIYPLCKRRRFVPGHCLNCNYDLTANTSGICPECGSPILKEKLATDQHGLNTDSLQIETYSSSVFNPCKSVAPAPVAAPTPPRRSSPTIS
jgi:hypothetical protein